MQSLPLPSANHPTGFFGRARFEAKMARRREKLAFVTRVIIIAENLGLLEGKDAFDSYQRSAEAKKLAFEVFEQAPSEDVALRAFFLILIGRTN